MSPKLRGLKPARVVKAFQKAGFEELRRKGSHVLLYKKGYPMIVIPIHGKEVKTGLLKDALKKAELTDEEFLRWL